VGVRETFERVVSRIGRGQGCKWGRAPGKCEACYVEPHPVSPDWDYWYPDLKPNADLSAWLVRLWELPALLPAVESYFRESDRPLSPAPVSAQETSAAATEVDPELARCAREQRAGIAAASLRKAECDQFGFPLPSANGTGKHHKRE
jgi:hypothetical protein